MSDKAWKKTERVIAARLGGRRVPITGRQRGDVPDVDHPTLSIEVKHRKSLPDWLFDALAQANASRKSGQLAVAVLHQKGKTHDHSIVCMTLQDFEQWHVRLKGDPHG